MKDSYVNLNTDEVCNAVAMILDNTTATAFPPRRRHVKFDNKRHMLVIAGMDVLCYDRHLHFPRKNQHLFAVHQFLDAVEKLFKARRDIVGKLRGKLQDAYGWGIKMNSKG